MMNPAPPAFISMDCADGQDIHTPRNVNSDISRATELLPQNDRERERFVTECRDVLRQMGFTVRRVGHRSWCIERTLSTSSMANLARTLKARDSTPDTLKRRAG